MQNAQQNYFNAAGVDPNPGAKLIYVWCQDRQAGNSVLIGSGHIVTLPGDSRPPGIQLGQFSVTFPLPKNCSASDITLTDDSATGGGLTNFVLTACSGGGVIHPGGDVPSAGARAGNAGPAHAAAHAHATQPNIRS